MNLISRTSQNFDRHVVVRADDGISHSPPILISPAQQALRTFHFFRFVITSSRRVERRSTVRVSVVARRLIFQIDSMLVEEFSALCIEVSSIMRPVEIGCETEIANRDVTVVREEEIVGFDVSMNRSQNLMSFLNR